VAIITLSLSANGIEKLQATFGVRSDSNRNRIHGLRTTLACVLHPPFALRCFSFCPTSVPNSLPLLGEPLLELASWADVLCRFFGRRASLRSPLSASAVPFVFGVPYKRFSRWRLLRVGEDGPGSSPGDSFVFPSLEHFRSKTRRSASSWSPSTCFPPSPLPP